MNPGNCLTEDFSNTMNNIKSFLLLLLSLVTGCEAASEVTGCVAGWAELTFTRSETRHNKDGIKIKTPRASPKIRLKDQWGTDGKLNWFHDTKKETVRLIIKELKSRDAREYSCEINKEPNYTLKVKDKEADGCQTPFHQTAYRAAETTITCDHPRPSASVVFLCRERGVTCEEILSTEASPGSKGRFTLTDASSSFSVSIRAVSPQDDGVYWCGAKSHDSNHRTSLRRIRLEVKDIKTFRRSLTAGQNLTYWCGYTVGAPIKKFICKGEDPSTCKPIVSTAQIHNVTARFSMKDDKQRNISITMRDVTTDDTGTYWCGAESTDRKKSNRFFHRLIMTVAPSPTPSTSPGASAPSTADPAGSRAPSPTPSTSPGASAPSTADPAGSRGGFGFVPTVIICVTVLLLLLLVPMWILIYRRCSRSTNTGNGAAAGSVTEDRVYEDMQEHLREPGTGNEMTAVYATATFPTSPPAPASLHYSTINFRTSSDKADGAARISSSSVCEYSALRCIRGPSGSAVAEPSRSAEEALYSTVTWSQQR